MTLPFSRSLSPLFLVLSIFTHKHLGCVFGSRERDCNTLQHATHCNTNTFELYTDDEKRTATHCNTLQHTATCCNTLQHTSHHKHPRGVYWRREKDCNTLQHATHCNVLQHTSAQTPLRFILTTRKALQHTATHCIARQHTATHGNTLQHAATLCNTLQHTATHCNTLQHAATHCNTLQHTATHCNTLQHTATHCNTLQHTDTANKRDSAERDSQNRSSYTAQQQCCSVLKCVAVYCSVQNRTSYPIFAGVLLGTHLKIQTHAHTRTHNT